MTASLALDLQLSELAHVLRLAFSLHVQQPRMLGSIWRAVVQLTQREALFDTSSV